MERRHAHPFLGNPRIAAGTPRWGSDPGLDQKGIAPADGRKFTDEAALKRFLDTKLEFSLRSSYGGNTLSVEIVGGDLCVRAPVKHNCMLHHNPAHDHDRIYSVLGETRRHAEIAGENDSLRVSTAFDGIIIDL